MKKFLILLTILTCVSLGLSVFLLTQKNRESDHQLKTVFMDSFSVFEEFTMKSLSSGTVVNDTIKIAAINKTTKP